MSFEDHVRVIEARFTCKLPTDYVEFIRSSGSIDQDFPEGWLMLYPIDQIIGFSEAGELQSRCPGAVVVGGDGSREMLAFDMRQSPPPLVLFDITAASWADAFFQAPSFAEFIASFPQVGWRFE